ncbi:MAG: acyl-CoA dehydrogenase family protein [Acidimicrobiia bacterium]|nr:acyl-CoA dehydrogenase family protein [Acidimicrobiia bacterium]MDH4307267.1 acyl-CoA dehydrogenase family protein [Acidimicrobiia bacterium]MDH5293389.1 acyl-CoA dehydrogenase family protein [Acidimicrobiia bacterium]
MDFSYSPKVTDFRQRLLEFMDEHVYPAEPVYQTQMEEAGDPNHHPPVIEELKRVARTRGLWNLFLPDPEHGAGLTVEEYAPLAEITGRSPWLAPEALNCSAPDTGNMEILHMFGTPDQKERWLVPLLEGEIRSCFGMTEPDVASSDARNIRTRIERDGDDYVVTGRKWFSSGAASDRCKIAIVMGKTDPDADTYHQQSMILVPFDAPGVTVERSPRVFGYHDRGGHPVVHYDHVRVPASNLLGDEGGGFAIAQARLGPGRIHHCMRAIGAAERCFDLMVQRAKAREAFGGPISDKGVVQNWIAEARLRIEQARLLVLKTAWMIDNVGTKGARVEIAAIKVVAPETLVWVADRAMQVFGGAGFTEDFPLAEMYAMGRWLQIADGPDEVHMRSVARAEIGRYEPGAVPPPYVFD